MASTSDTQELPTRDLALLVELGSAAENLAERSKAPGLDAATRAALRNHAKLANEQAGALLARGTVVLFGNPPGEAAKAIDAAVAGTQRRLGDIQKASQAIEVVGALVGVATAVLAGDWKAVAKSLEKVVKKKVG